MKSKIAIYLAGTIKKEHENPDDSFWSTDAIKLLRDSFSQYEVTCINPAVRGDDLSNRRSVFGRAMLQVFSSHAVFVDARDRRGIGVGVEMLWAKMHKIPVVSWAPKNSHYHRDKANVLGVDIDNFIHPFVKELSDKIVENLPEGAEWIEKAISDPSSVEIKSTEDVHSAINYYKSVQLDSDLAMMKLAEEGLEKRMNRPHLQVTE